MSIGISFLPGLGCPGFVCLPGAAVVVTPLFFVLEMGSDLLWRSWRHWLQAPA